MAMARPLPGYGAGPMSVPEEPSFSAIKATLKKAVAALRDADVPFLLGGSSPRGPAAARKAP